MSRAKYTVLVTRTVVQEAEIELDLPARDPDWGTTDAFDEARAWLKTNGSSVAFKVLHPADYEVITLKEKE